MFYPHYATLEPLLHGTFLILTSCQSSAHVFKIQPTIFLELLRYCGQSFCSVCLMLFRLPFLFEHRDRLYSCFIMYFLFIVNQLYLVCVYCAKIKMEDDKTLQMRQRICTLTKYFLSTYLLPMYSFEFFLNIIMLKFMFLIQYRAFSINHLTNNLFLSQYKELKK